MSVSKDGQFLLVMDSRNVACVYPAGRSLNGARPIVHHDFRGEYPAIGVLSGPQPDQFVIVGGGRDGNINYLIYGFQQSANGDNFGQQQQRPLARGKIITP